MTNAFVEPTRVAANWAAIAAVIDAPTPSRTERFLGRLRIPATTTRLLAATPALRRAWFLALAATALLGLAAADAARPRESLFVLLFLAPLVPVLGVSFAYGPGADPAYEITVATPKSGLRLALIRSFVVLTVTIIALGLTALMTPEPAPLAFAWLLPAFATSGASVAAMTTVAPRRAALGVTVGWTAAVFVAWIVTGNRLAAFAAPAQALWLLAAIATGAVIARRRHQFDRVWMHR